MPEVDVCGGKVVYAFVISLMIVMANKFLDPRFEVFRAK
jgi:hypothetical protein